MNRIMVIIILLFSLNVLAIPFNTGERNEVVLEGIDIDQSLLIAGRELQSGGRRASLGLWALRDQIITPVHALRITHLYFNYIDELETRFDVWHLSWAISNLYRSADGLTRGILRPAFIDAKERSRDLHRIAKRHIQGERIYRGDIHFLGRLYSRRHLVVPGNNKYLQSAGQYFERKGYAHEFISVR